MYRFEELGRFNIPGRGTVVTVKNLRYPELYDPSTLFGEEVQIGDQTFRVRGIETFSIHRSKENPYRLNFGILI